jgi:hypothetical protein
VTADTAVTLHRDHAGVFLEARLPPGHVAFVDGDAVDQSPAGPVEAIVVTNDADAVRRAAHAFATAARHVVELLSVQPDRPVEVAGNGLLAHLIRAPLGGRATIGLGEGPPVAVVDTSGSPARIADALRRLDELGTLILAGQARGRDLTLNLYTDLHRRSLTITGVPAPVLNGPPPDGWRLPVHVALAEPRRVVARTNVLPGAVWYLLEPEGTIGRQQPTT